MKDGIVAAAVALLGISVMPGASGTARAGWGGAEIIDAGAGSGAIRPHVAMREDGTAIAVFQQHDGTNYRGYATLWDGSAWTGVRIIDAGPGNAVYYPQIAMDVGGRAIVVFLQGDGAYDRVYANLWNGSAWTGAQLIDASTGHTAYDPPQIAFDGKNGAIAVFGQYDGVSDRIFANRWDGSAWTGATPIDAGTAQNAYLPKIASDGSGKAIAVYQQNLGVFQRIYANRWDGSAWAGAVLIDAGLTDDAWDPQVALDASGNAIAVFRQEDGTINRIYANRWNGSSWGLASQIDAGAGKDAQSPRIGLDGSGNAVAVFQQSDGANSRIYANRWIASGWAGAQIVDTGPGRDAHSPQVSFDRVGNAVAVFEQTDGSNYRVCAHRWNGAAWAGAVQIDAGPGYAALHPQIALDGSGRAIAVFEQTDGTASRIRANRYAPPIPTPTVVPQAQIVLNGTAFSAGQRFVATFRLNRSIARMFTAYAVIVLPDGSMRNALTLGQAIDPVASNMPRLDAPFEYPLLDLDIPAGASTGDYSVMAGFFTPGQPITGPQGAFLLAAAPFAIR